MNNKEKFFQIVSNEETDTITRTKVRQQRRAHTRLSQQIALSILERLDELNWDQEKLAKAMNVSPLQVNNWVRGGENFRQDTLSSLESILNTTLTTIQPQEPVGKIS